ncbi:MAG: beta galactosidase jelly roll domain-containing protein [Calditrichaceae bacterium]|nr:beta galactosidase jelly roll domain-containing protein [Calditrichaceae bacterium]MBN2710595.1 beta galactosidase jelly roll domain-containing protein [Calditrichaceae bacterium]RQV94785.1 MAG: sialate O-acetylesterase [Calditrichota bacterium]
MNKLRITRIKYAAYIFCIFAVLPLFSAFGQVRLPKLIGDGMILQRNTEVKIWGWASVTEQITIHFNDSTYQTTADANGAWQIILPPMDAGGPYTMQINGANQLTIRDIMAGDVWLCSGQSNMELPMRRVSWVYEEEIQNSENEYIRHFLVPDIYNFKEPQQDLQDGSWKKADPQNVLNFSAVGYFFAKELYDQYKIPIGLINASLGGSPAEAWMSPEALKAFPEHYNEAQRFKDDRLITQIENDDRVRITAWYKLLGQKDKGYQDRENTWHKPDLNTENWPVMEVPGYWADTDLGPANGAVWFRKKITVPASMAGKPAKLILGRIVDADSVFINGIFAGTTGYQYPPRRYDIPAGILTEGENTIVVRVVSNSGQGGFVLDKSYEIVAGEEKIDLAGPWQYQSGAVMEPLAGQTFVRWKPTGLFNAMIAPLLNYKLKGVIWYQGESNAERPEEHRTLFPALISDWRKHWQQGDFPFLYVQLPNFMEAKSEPGESQWALFRESQLQALSTPNTAMAVAIDIGEWNDIHPLNKKDVGYRLALGARKIAYGDRQVVHSGPVFEAMHIKNGKIIVSFSNIGSGLVAKDQKELKHFAIAGKDKKFVQAFAKIEKDKVIVWSDAVPEPVAVRYAWADNPQGANLYNKEGLPASPFKTDDWTLKENNEDQFNQE